jgi:membrane-bound lytic murein transglycosylase B
VALVVLVGVLGACSSSGRERAAGEQPAPGSTGPATTLPPSPGSPPPPPVPADPAAALAERITAVETALRAPSTPADRLAALGGTQQDTYRALVGRPDLRPAVLSRVPEALRPVVEANVTAGVELRALSRPGRRLPPWRIVEPAPADDLLRHYKEGEAAYGIPWPYLAAIHLVETRMGRIRGTSPAGAQGPMQFIPTTWARYGQGDVNSNRDSILAAARYLQASGGPADMSKALWHYNHSLRYVRGVSTYADQMRRDERAFRGYYHWQVFFLLATGEEVLLPVGYGGP